MLKTQIIMLSVAALVIVGGAVKHGFDTDRWTKQHSEKLNTYTSRLESLPTEFGDWTSIESEVDPAQFKASGCDGSYSRLFTNSLGEQISVFLVSGRGYHVTIHTPNFCYVAAGYEMRNDPIDFEFEAPELPKTEVVHTVFKKDLALATNQLRILWTYTVDGNWRSPKLAKYTYGSEDAMYKLYLIRSVDGGIPDIGDDPAVEFAKEFLPVVNATLFASSDSAQESEPKPLSVSVGADSTL